MGLTPLSLPTGRQVQVFPRRPFYVLIPNLMTRQDPHHVRRQGRGGRHRHGRQPALLRHGGDSGQEVPRHGEISTNFLIKNNISPLY